MKGPKGTRVVKLDLSERKARAVLDGVLVIDKPTGWTSHDVVAKVRTLLRIRKVGHTGTLDPCASGVLLLCLGRATRIAEYLINSDKAYRAVLRLGVTTDTQDAAGTVVRRHVGALPDTAAIRAAMSRFVGIQRQVPPMYSAVKVKGVPLYKSARAGRTIPREAREFRVRSLEILAITPALSTIDVAFDVVCSKGTYVRTLCADIGEALGVGGHLARLERRKVGRFGIEDALTLDELAASAERGDVSAHLQSPAAALADLPAVTLDAVAAERALHGAAVPFAHVAEVEGTWAMGAHIRLRTRDGRLLAIGKAPCGREEMERFSPGAEFRVEKVLA
jgi:tRNA pseudouridine55 synthase